LGGVGGQDGRLVAAIRERGGRRRVVDGRRCRRPLNTGTRKSPTHAAIIAVFRECCSRCRFQPHDCVVIRYVEQITVRPETLPMGNVSTVWFMVCRWPQSQEGDWARPHLCKIARHRP